MEMVSFHCLQSKLSSAPSVASEAYRDWSGEAVGARLHVNFTLKLLPSQSFCNRPLMRFISFASNIGPAATVPAGPAPAPLSLMSAWFHAVTDGLLYTFCSRNPPSSSVSNMLDVRPYRD